MATYPPPPGFDPRQQARLYRAQLKAQRVAQKAAFRAQREAFRFQARATRRGSIVGPLIFVGLGVVFLLIQFGRIPGYRIEQWFSQWWPLVLVVAGLVLVLEWVFDNYSHAEGLPPTRRGVGGGVIFLLILIALTGASMEGFHNFHESILPNLHIGPDNVGEIFGDKHESQQLIDQAFPAGTSLNVQSPRGDVSVTGTSTDNMIHVVVNKQVYTWSDDDATKQADELVPNLQLSGSTLNLTLPSVNSARADLTITLPAGAQTTVTTTHGTITVSDIAAPISVTSNDGDITIDRINASVSAHINHSGDSFAAHTIRGDVSLRGHADDLNLSDITGQVTLEGEFFGDTHLENLTGPLSFRTSRTQFSVARLDGVVDISVKADMSGSQLVGPVELHTRSRNISFQRIAGPVNISNSHGTVDLTSAAPVGNITVDNSDGEVNLTVPLPLKGKPGFSLETRNRNGGIQDQLDGFEVDNSPSPTHSATYGDPASHISLTTTHADITIHNSAVEPPSPPSPPSPKSPSGPPSPHSPPSPPSPKSPKSPKSPPSPDF